MQQRTPEEYKAAYEHHKAAGNRDKAARVAQLYRQHLSQQPQVAPEDRDNAFQYSIDQAQKMYGGAVQNVGRLAGSKGIEQYGKQVSDKQDQDIAKGAYQSNYSTARDSYNKEGLPGVFKWAAEGVAENAVSGGAALVGAAGTALASYLGAPVWAVGALGTLTLGNSIALNTGDNVLEQQEKTGDFDERVATGVGVIAGILDRVGAGRAIPKPDLAKMTTQEVIDELKNQGKKKAAVEFAKRIGAEGVTETAQDALNMGGTALVGGEYTADEVKDRTLDSFLLGSAQAGIMNTGISTLSSATNLVKGSGKKAKSDADTEAQASLAKRLSDIAFTNKYDLKDIDKMSTVGARETVDKAHVQYTEELKQLFKDLKSRVKVTDQDTLQVVSEKILAEAAYREGRNKTKNTVGAQEMAALERLAGDTFEGQQAMSILRQLNQLTEIHNGGYQGGVSKLTDQLSPLGTQVGYDKGAVATERILRPLVSGSAAITTGGTSLLGQLGAQGTGRMIDKVTGRRSTVDRFVRQNQNEQGIPQSGAPSLRMQRIAEEQAAAQAAQEAELASQAAAEQRAAEEREANLDRVQKGAPPLQGSPEDIFRDGTGLDRSGLAQVIRILKANPNTKAAVRRAIEAYETSIATGGRVDFSLIRDINSLVDQFPQLKQLQVRPRNQATANQAIQQQYSQQQQNYERGIENNRQFAKQLTDALNADKSVQPIHKALLLDSLGQMQLDLGANPVSRLKAMQDRLAEKDVPADAVQKYFVPYIERVVAQQNAKQSLENTEQAVEDDTDPVNDSRIAPITRGAQALKKIIGDEVSQRKQRAEEQGYDTSTVYYHGTASDITSFEKGKRGLSTGSTSAQNGFWFSDSPETARSYAHHSGTYAPVHNLIKEAEDADAVYGAQKIDQETMLVLDELITSAGIDANGFAKDSDGNPIPVSGYDAYDKLIDTAEKLELKFNSGDRNNGQNIIPIYPPKDADLLVKDMEGKSFNDEGVSPEINGLMRKAKLIGKKGVKLLNLNDSAGIAEDPSTHLAIFEPSNIRSVNAQFDPGKTESDKIVDSRLPALTNISSPNVISLMDGSETAPKLTGKTEVANFLQERALEKLGGKPRDLAVEADRDAIADDMVAEAIYEMENSESAMEWYDSVISQMVEMMSLKHPELKTDEDAKTALLVSIAITSQNLAVPENLKYGEEVYNHFKNNGQFLEKKYGSKGNAVKQNLVKANKLLTELGSMEAMRDFLETKFTVRELDPILQQHLNKNSKQISGENMDTEVYGSQVFGPKIGNGFYTNLRGDFSPVTIDMWFMRTVGRLQGKVLAFDQAKFNNQLTRLKTALGRKRMSEDALVKKAKELKSKHESDFKKYRKDYDSGKRSKSDAVKAAEQIVISLKGTRDVPASGAERQQLRDVVTKAVAKFKNKTGIDIPPASFQALIWYPEQDLYKNLGVQLKSTRQDYASSTKQLLIEEGYNEADLNAAADRVRQLREQGPGPVRQTTGAANREADGRTGGSPGRFVQQEETGPVLATEDPVNNSVEAAFARVQKEYLQPTPSEIKEKLPEAEDVVQFTIGKKGTSYEQGITSEADIRRIADLLNVSISVINKMGNVEGVISTEALGNYKGSNRGTAGHINVRSKDILGKDKFLVTLLHEVSHGLESQTLDGEEAGYNFDKSPHPKGSKKYNADNYRHGSFREHMHYVLRLAKGDDIYGDYQPDVSHLSLPDYDEAVEIRKEIDQIQETDTAVRFMGFPEGTVDTEGLVVRPSVDNLVDEQAAELAERFTGEKSGKLFDESFKNQRATILKMFDKSYTDYVRYTKDVAEFSVDPLILYLQDPQMMKLVAPTTSKYIQKVFNKANMPVKFYSSPLVALMAILLAGIGKGIGGEEEEQVPGALSMQPGLLST